MFDTKYYRKIPKDTLDRLIAYGRDREEVHSGFLYQCLRNDFVGAATQADGTHQGCLSEIALFIYNQLPSGCWGSKEKVDDWLDGFINGPDTPASERETNNG